MELSYEITINRPIDEVFSYWADLERAGEWAAPVIERRKLTEGPVGVGTKYKAVDQFPGRRVEFIVEVTAYEPGQFMAASWTKPMAGGWEARFSEAEQGTRLAIHAVMKPSGILKLLAPIMSGWAKQAMLKDLGKFKELLESG